MSYTALYRKFRPSEFGDVKGQEHIVTTLQNQIKANRIGHAYLFCGTRGTGKTTAAKIFARAVNCEHPVDGSPCGVYIIDEVHMLSPGAFNALLKTLEEPPEYVIFILATTEVHKIPVTIMSRCQHYDFRRITIETISARLKELMEAEQVEVEDKAIRYIAKAADGSMRDALSLLDQCIAFYLGQKLTYDNVLEVLGAVDTDVFSRLLRSLIGRKVPQVLDTVEDLVMQGRELLQLSVDFTWYLRNLLLVKTSDMPEDVLDVSSENLAQLKEESEMIEADALLRYIRIFSELSEQLRFATQKRVLLEVTLIKLCTPAMEVRTDSLLDRIRALEEKLEKGLAVAQAQGGMQPGGPQGYPEGSYPGGFGGYPEGGYPAGSGGYPQGAYPGGSPGEAGKPEVPLAIPEEVQEVVKNFRSIAEEVSAPVSTYLKKARLSLGGENRLMVVLPDGLGASIVGTEEHKKELEERIEQRIGKKVQVEVREMEEGRHFEDTFVDIEKKINMEITVED